MVILKKYTYSYSNVWNHIVVFTNYKSLLKQTDRHFTNSKTGQSNRAELKGLHRYAQPTTPHYRFITMRIPLQH